MIRPALFIGVGGSGGKTLRYIADETMRILDESGWDKSKGMPAPWQFLHIDVPGERDIDGGDVPADSAAAIRWVGLAESASHGWDVYFDRLVGGGGNLDAALVGWAPPRESSNITAPYSGAGQRRVIGRIVGLSLFDKVSRAIDKAESAILQSSTDFMDVAGLLSPATDAAGVSFDRGKVVVYVVASIGGGSGSGMVGDIVDYLTGKDISKNDLHTVLYSGDIFQHLAGSAPVGGTLPNSLAAISEFLNGRLQTGPTREPEATLLQQSVGYVPNGLRGALGMNAIISGSNGEGLTFQHQNQCFRSVGHLLANLTLGHSGRTYEEIVHFGLNNDPGQSFSEAFRLFGPTDSGQNGNLVKLSTSLGFASVSLGSQLLEDFATEAIARSLVDSLVDGPIDAGRSGGQASPTHTELVENEATSHKITFFDYSGLHEEGEDNNHVIDCLWDLKAVNAQWKEFKDSPKLSGVNKGLNAQLEELVRAGSDPETLYKRACKSHQQLGESFTAAGAAGEGGGFDADQFERCDQLVKAIEQKVLTISLQIAASYGIDTALALLDDLKGMTKRAAVEMQNDSNAAFEKANAYGGQVQKLGGVFAQAAEKIGLGEGGKLENLQKHLDAQFLVGLKAKAHANAASILRGASSDLIPAVEVLLRGIKNDLETDRKDDKRGGKAYKQWARLSDVTPPIHLQPANNEVLLIDPKDPKDGFKATVDEYLPRTFGSDVSLSDAVKRCSAEAFSGNYEGTAGPLNTVKVRDGDAVERQSVQSLVSNDRPWSVQLEGLDRKPVAGGGSSPGVGPYAIRGGMSIARIRDLCQDWIGKRADSELRRATRKSLSKWIEESGEKKSREQDFVNAINKAFTYASPMVECDEQAFLRIHENPKTAPSTAFSIAGDIPLVEGEVAEEIKALLAARGITGQVMSPTEATKFGIVGVLQASTHVAAMKSVVEPIHRDWQQSASQPGTRRAYWLDRRSRQIDNFVPVSRARVEALIRGWLIAGFLGQIKGQAEWIDQGIRIWTPSGWKSFPRFPMVASVDRVESVLPRLIECLPAAMLAYGTSSPQNWEPVAAYTRLLELGNDSIKGGEVPAGEQSELSSSLTKWLKHGELDEPLQGVEPAPVPSSKTAGPSNTADDPAAFEERKQLLTEKLNYFLTKRFGPAEEARNGVTSHTFDRWEPTWDLGSAGVAASKALLSGVTVVEIDQDEVGY